MSARKKWYEKTRWWVTKTGEKLTFQQMDDTHLVNAYRLVLRRFEGWRLETEIEGFKTLSGLNGEMAIESVENDLEALANSTAEEEWPIAEAMLTEISRRKLNGQLVAG